MLCKNLSDRGILRPIHDTNHATGSFGIFFLTFHIFASSQLQIVSVIDKDKYYINTDPLKLQR